MLYLLFDFWRTIIDPPDLDLYYRYRVRNILKVEGIEDPGIEERAFNFYRRLFDAFDSRRRASCIEIPATLELESFLSFLEVENVEDEHLRAYASPMLDLTTLKPRAKETLDKLSSKYELAVVSNTPYHDMVVERLRKDGLLDFFQVIVSSHRVGVRKPTIEIFMRALEVMGARPEEAVMIGDSPYEDIEGAKKAGMRTIWVVREGVQRPDADSMIKSLGELPNLLKVIV
ncbi:MAG: HAD family hydrolase [Candidatus Korarchaeota archaeon]|nr:HAD family hydrolase [Candidatus Korarchaeota archaeon]